MFGSGWYTIFTLFLCVEFYKMYVDHFCSVQKFEIKKLVSTRQDLTQQAIAQPYQQYIPAIVYQGNTKVFDPINAIPVNYPVYDYS